MHATFDPKISELSILLGWRGTQGNEASEYLVEKKTIVILLVGSTESRGEQTESHIVIYETCGVVHLFLKYLNRSNLERFTIEGDSPVDM